MLEVRPRNVFSSTWDVLENDAPVALLRVKHLTEAAALEILEGPSLMLDRERLMSGAFRLRRDDQVLAQARKPSAWRSAFVIDLGGTLLHLKPDSCWSTSFTLYRQDEPVGHVARRGVWKDRAMAELPEDWPLPVRIFVLWLAMLIWQRNNAAAASG